MPSIDELLMDPALPGHIREAIQRGRGIVQGTQTLARGAVAAGKAVGRGINTVLAPATTVGPPILRGAQRLGGAVARNPAAAKAVIGGAMALPILSSSFSQNQRQEENNLMQTRHNPERDVTASLDEFLEKKASQATYQSTKTAAGIGGLGQMFGQAAQGAAKGPTPANSFAEYAQHMGQGVRSSGAELGGAAAKGAGGAIAQGALGLLKHVFELGNEAMFVEPKRKATFATVLRTDPVISDFAQSNPEHLSLLKDAFATLCRFAPSLAVDVNVVRSYLREVALSGGGVNYATVKNLIDTERALKGKDGQIR